MAVSHWQLIIKGMINEYIKVLLIPATSSYWTPTPEAAACYLFPNALWHQRVRLVFAPLGLWITSFIRVCCQYFPNLCCWLIFLGYSWLLVLMSQMKIWVISAGSPIQTDFALLGPSVLRPLKPVLYVYVFSSFITNFPHTSFLYHVYDWRYSLCDRKTIYTELVCGEIICGEIVLLSVPFFSMASSSF